MRRFIRSTANPFQDTGSWNPQNIRMPAACRVVAVHCVAHDDQGAVVKSGIEVRLQLPGNRGEVFSTLDSGGEYGPIGLFDNALGMIPLDANAAQNETFVATFRVASGVTLTNPSSPTLVLEVEAP